MDEEIKTGSPLRSGGRREFFKRTLALSVFSKVWWSGDVQGSIPSANISRGPYLQSLGTTTVIIRWRSTVATTSEVALGTNPQALVTQPIPAGTRTEHQIVVTGLVAGTQYHYQCGGVDAGGTRRMAGGADFVFRTAPVPGAGTSGRFWILGDCGSHPSVPWGFPESVQTSALFLSQSLATGKAVDGILLLGDNAYNIGSDSEYQAAVFSKYASLLRRSPAWSTFGNHDAYTLPYPFTGDAPYDTIFSFPKNGECGGVPSGSGRYYSFDHGGIHFICLDNNTLGYYDKKPGEGGMIDWLISDLKACTADWIIAFFHHPPYSKGTHDSDTQWNLVRSRDFIVPLLERYGVDLVLCGHSHQYQRSCLIDGHYGNSSSYNPSTMRKGSGNGSETGAIDTAGNFVPDEALAGGSYQKPAATGRGGAVYAVIGSSGKVDAWPGGATNVVNPTPHPVHVVNLRVIGGLVIEVTDNKLRGEYRDANGLVRDEFNVLKGSHYRLAGIHPHFTSPTQPGAAVRLERTGALSLADQVVLRLQAIQGATGLPSTLTVNFNAGERVKSVPLSGLANGDVFQISIEAVQRRIEPDVALRRAYQFTPTTETLRMGPTPAATWYASHFGQLPPNPQVWDSEPDADGVPLIMKYALGLKPGEKAGESLKTLHESAGNMVISFVMPPGRTDVSYKLEESDDLVTWIPSAALPVASGPEVDAGTPHEFRVPKTGSESFYRLSVSLIP